MLECIFDCDPAQRRLISMIYTINKATWSFAPWWPDMQFIWSGNVLLTHSWWLWEIRSCSKLEKMRAYRSGSLKTSKHGCMSSSTWEHITSLQGREVIYLILHGGMPFFLFHFIVVFLFCILCLLLTIHFMHYMWTRSNALISIYDMSGSTYYLFFSFSFLFIILEEFQQRKRPLMTSTFCC